MTYVCEYNYTYPNTDGHTYTTYGREHASNHIQTCTYLISFAHMQTHIYQNTYASTNMYIHRIVIKQITFFHLNNQYLAYY